MTDCLIIGFNDGDFARYADQVRAMGENSGAYRDLRLALVHLEDRPLRALEVLSRYYFEGDPQPHGRFHNADFLWPVITVLGSYLAKFGLTHDFVNLFQDEKEALREKLERDDVLTVAITTTLYVVPDPIIEIVRFVRRHNARAKIIVGGPFISSRAKNAMREEQRGLYRALGADIYVTSNEGEAALVALIKALKAGTSLSEVANLVYRDGSQYVVTKAEPEYNPIEENLTNYRLFERRRFGQFVSTRTAKSCPFSCAFCGFPQRAGKYKYLSVEDVERELDAIAEIGGITTLTFLDDTFNVPPKRFKELLRLMIRKSYGFRWNSFYRADHGDEETIELMAQAGCEGVFLGVESGSDAMLKLMNKTARRKHYTSAIRQLTDLGVSTYASLIVGFPGETRDTLQETIDFLEEARPEFYRAQLWYCDPITPVWDRREELGINGFGFRWSHATMNADQAAQAIDEMFLSIKGSLWMPQFGFEQWSTFYLQRRGFTLRQVKDFVTAFNSAVKAQMLHGKRRLPADLLADLRASCRTPKGERYQGGAVVRYSAERYHQAVRHWAGVFTPPSPGDAARATHRAPEPTWRAPGAAAASAARRWTTIDRVAPTTAAPYAAEWATVLAAFARRVGNEIGARRVPILVVLDGAGQPDRIPLLADINQPDDVLPADLRAQAEGGRVHSTFARYLLTTDRALTPTLSIPLRHAFLYCGLARDASDLDAALGEFADDVQVACVVDEATHRTPHIFQRAGADAPAISRSAIGTVERTDTAARLATQR